MTENSRPNVKDRVEFEVELARAVSERCDEATGYLVMHVHVLEEAILEYARRHESQALSPQDLARRIRERVEVWMLKEHPERPLLFSSKLVDWLYPPPAAEPEANGLRSKWVVDDGDHAKVYEAVSADAACHMATVEAMTAFDSRSLSNDDKHREYYRIRRLMKARRDT